MSLAIERYDSPFQLTKAVTNLPPPTNIPAVLSLSKRSEGSSSSSGSGGGSGGGIGSLIGIICFLALILLGTGLGFVFVKRYFAKKRAQKAPPQTPIGDRPQQ